VLSLYRSAKDGRHTGTTSQKTEARRHNFGR